MRASTTATQEARPPAAYREFYDAVATAQLQSWLPATAQLLIDLSGPASRAATLAAAAGHQVVEVIDPSAPAKAGAAAQDGPGHPEGSRRCQQVAADGNGLDFLADGCADGVIAEDGTLSRRLAAEAVVADIRRVLRPGGRVLACVDSLTTGMAALAEQNRWPHLADLPNAEVVLVPWPDGTITRCYGTEQLHELFTSAGFTVNWIRPRTVLSASTVSYLVGRDPGSLRRLVKAELQLAADDSVGSQLVACATRR